MKFRLQAEDLNEALAVASIVPPMSVTSQGGAGFLFVVKEGSCSIHSRDALRQARVEIPITDVDGDGSFIYPSAKIKELPHLDGWIEFEAGHDEDDDRYWVKYHTEGGAEAERSTYDPRLVQSMDEALEKAGEGRTFPVAPLKEGLRLTQSYLTKPNDTRTDDRFKVLQLFDDSKKEWARGDGHLFASDHVRACYFFCEVFKGKGLAIHGQHLPMLTAFLAKCEGDVTLKQGEGVTYLLNSKGWAVAWAHYNATHGKFGYYSHKEDSFILKVPKDILVKTLRYTRGALDKRQDKIRVRYNHENTSLQFLTSEVDGSACSILVSVVPVEGEEESGKLGKTEPFEANVNINYLLELFESMQAHEPELRVSIISAAKNRREVVLFRTIEEFWLSASGKVLINPKDTKEESYQCRVTRFMPSKD